MAAQIVSFLLYPIITRLFVPEDVGTLSLFMSFVFVSISLAPFQMDQLLLVSRSASESKKIIGMAILFGLVTIAALWGAISIFKGVTTESFSRVPWLAIAAFPLFTLPLIFYPQRYTFAIRENIFIAAASASSTAQVTATILKIGIGFFRPTLGTLFISELA